MPRDPNRKAEGVYKIPTQKTTMVLNLNQMLRLYLGGVKPYEHPYYLGVTID